LSISKNSVTTFSPKRYDTPLSLTMYPFMFSSGSAAKKSLVFLEISRNYSVITYYFKE
jgi:hypothetical protein